MTNHAALVAGRFNLFDEVLPAKTDAAIEAAMVAKLMKIENVPLDLAQAAVHDLVHVAKHYTVADGPAAS